MDKNKTLLLVESPAKAKTIQKYLGSEYIVRASAGHIKDITAESLGINLDTFRPNYHFMTEKKALMQTIIDASQFAKEILIASDPDREGEAIAFHLRDLIRSSGIPVKRVKFHEITKKEILKVLQTPEELNEKLYDAQQARRTLDRLVGFLASPFLNRSLSEKGHKKLSAGRVQSATLRILAEREKEIQSFQPEEYWNIEGFFSSSSNAPQSEFSARLIEKQKITSQEKAEKIEKEILNSSFQVSKIKEEKKKRPPEPPFITSTLCSAASSVLKFPTEKTMKVAQTLYESGLITYMRTDSLYLSSEATTEIRNWLSKNNYSFPKSPPEYKNKNNSAQEAHEAIRPTDISRTMIVGSTDEISLYQLIWKRTIASQMLPAVFAATQIEILSSNNHLFRLTGSVLKEENWLAIYKGQIKTSDVLLPKLENNQKLYLAPPKTKKEKKFTQPPNRYTEGSLVLELEKRGIGRPSTYATIFSKLLARNYVSKKNESYIVTSLGLEVIDVLQKYFHFLDLTYTAQMEEKLDLIADGKIDYLIMMRQFFSEFCEELKFAYMNFVTLGDESCQECGMPMALKHSSFGYFLGCLNFPSCKNIVPVTLVDGKIIPREMKVETSEKCPDCQSPMNRRDGSYGAFYSCSRWPKCYGRRKIIYPQTCPLCKNSGMTTFVTSEKKLMLSCIKYPECKGVEEAPEKLQASYIPPQNLKMKEFSSVRAVWNKGKVNEKIS
jgi:DNA topoisomerase-1